MESCHQCTAVCEGGGVLHSLVLPLCIRRDKQMHTATFLPATAITVHSDTNAPWDSYWHYMGRLEEGDANSMARQAKFSWAITAKVRVIFSLKAKYYHSEQSCLPLNVHSQKIIWKKIKQPQTTLIPALPISPLTQRSLNSPGQWNNTNSHFSDALEPSRRMRKFVREL